MSDRNIIRRRIPASRPKIRPSNHSPSPRGRRRTPTPIPRWSKPSKPSRILQRCKSEPILWDVSLVYTTSNETDQHPKSDFILFRPKTCTDVFTSPIVSPSSPSNFEMYKKDSKVVINVTVEGCSGPIRTLVRLGASVEDTIKLVVDKYSDEGRRPHLDLDKGTSEFELHHSHFSLESIKRTETIGGIGSRSFYLRKSSSVRNNGVAVDDETAEASQGLVFCYSAPEIFPLYSSVTVTNPAAITTPSSSTTTTTTTATQQKGGDEISPFVFLPAYIIRKMSKIGRRTRRLWKILGCIK